MEGGLLHRREPRRPAGTGLALCEGLLRPAVGVGVGGRQLVQREGLADSSAQLLEDDVHFLEQTLVA